MIIVGADPMALEFHFEDRLPQDWLNDFRAIGIDRLWDPQLRPTQRENLLERAKQDLKVWRLGLRDQMETIKMRYGDDNKQELSLMLSPYNKLEDLGTNLNNAMKDLESKMKSGRALPLGVTTKEYIFGSLQTGRWYFGDLDEMRLYDEFENVERRYFSIKAEYDEQSSEYKMTAGRVRDHQADIRKLTKEYNARKGFLQLGLRLFVVSLVSILSLALGVLGFTMKPYDGMVMSNEAFGGIMLIIGLVGFMIAIVLTRRRRRRVNVLREEILSLKSDEKTLRREAQRLKKGLLPTHHTYKAISKQYKEYRTAFR